MKDIYESSIPSKCSEDCKDGLIFADPKDKNAQVYVFSCYCARGLRHKHYSRWHPVLSPKTYSRSQEEVSITPSPVFEAKQEDVPLALIEHFEAGEFVSEAWDLLRELYGREQLAKWYKVWKKDGRA